MKILGITGSLNLVHEDSDGDHYDAAAGLVVDGKVAAAIEEERLNRIKHTDKFPVNAIRFVLQQQDLKLEDLDQICYYSIQNEMNDFRTLGELMDQKRFNGVEEKKALLDEILELWKSRFISMNHHLAG